MNQPIPPGSAQAVEASGNQATGRAVGLTPHLIRQFAAGGELTGRVAASGAEGRLQITTPHGTLTLQTGTTLPPGTPVTLQVTSLGPPAQLAITPQVRPGAAASAQAGTSGTSGPGPGGTQPLPTLTATVSQSAQTALQATRSGATGQNAQAGSTAQPAAPSGNAPAAQTAGATASVQTTLSTGATLQAQVTASPAGTQATGGAAGQPGSASATPTALQTALAAGKPLPAGTGLAVRITGLALPGQTPPTLPPATTGSAPTLMGTVTGQNAAGQTLVSTSAGTLALATNGSPPAGTQVTLELAGTPRPPAPGAGQASATLATARFGGIEQALQLLNRAGGDFSAGGAAQASAQAGAQAGVQQALQMLQNVLPQQNAQMAPAMLFFMSALRAGGLDRLIGSDRANALERAQHGLSERIEGDMRGAASGRARDGAGGEWRALSLPMLNDGELERIRLYMRDRRGDGEEGGDDASRPQATRFIIEAEFSRLGQMQFDGLVREKSFDLVVRTRTPFEQEMRDTIRRLFTDQVSALGWSGTVSYQVVRAFNVVPVEGAFGAESGVTV